MDPTQTQTLVVHPELDWQLALAIAGVLVAILLPMITGLVKVVSKLSSIDRGLGCVDKRLERIDKHNEAAHEKIEDRIVDGQSEQWSAIAGNASKIATLTGRVDELGKGGG